MRIKKSFETEDLLKMKDDLTLKELLVLIEVAKPYYRTLSEYEVKGIFISVEDKYLCDKLHLTLFQVQNAKKSLRKKGFIQTRMLGKPPVTHYKVTLKNLTTLLLEEIS